MKVYQILFTLITISFFQDSILHAQLANFKLRELAHADAADMAQKLNLSQNQEKSLASIFYDFDSQLKSSIDLDNYQELYQKIHSQEHEAIKALLGEHTFKKFIIFEELEILNLQDNYQELSSSFRENPDFTMELISYKLKHIFPVLSHYHEQLTDDMRVRDYRFLQALQDEYYSSIEGLTMDDSSDSIIQNVRSVLPENFAMDLNKILTKYDENYALIKRELTSYEKRWNKDLENIYLNHYSQNHLNQIKKINEEDSKTSVNSQLDKFQFLLIEPYEEDLYLNNSALFFHLKDWLHSISKH